MRTSTTSALVAAFGLALSCGPATIGPRPPSPPPDPSISKAVGAGHYLTKILDGEPLPSDDRGAPVTPKVTADFVGTPTSNDWWSSLIWRFDRGKIDNPYSEVMWPHPLAVRAERRGLQVAYPTEATTEKLGYQFPFAADLIVGAEGLEAPDTKVARYSDWTVTASWGDGDGKKPLRMTIGHGSPYVYVETTGGRAARVEAGAALEVWKLDGEVAAVTVHGHHYGLFAPTGARWVQDGKALRAELGADDFYAVAALPDRDPATLALFRAHAYAFVTDSKVAWAYDPAAAAVTTTFTLEATLRQPGKGREATPLTTLYRHQWLHTDAPLTGHVYKSPRGAMKLIAAAAFATKLPFHGVVPALPVVAEGQRGRLRELVDDAYHTGNLFPPGLDGKKDAYWTGKSMGRLSTLVHLADQVGHVKARDQFVRAIENELEDWFDGQAPFAFYYDAAWRSLLGMPSSYFSGAQLNDHHFHYGYFVFAAATVAQFDPAWAAPDKWGGMVDLLIRDAANIDRDDHRFPFLRHFDAYAGHSWANGPALFERGNNEESSSEDINFSVATILWGAVTGDRELRDLGVFLYANEVAAIQQYWFDVDGEVFPDGFDPPTIAILWGDGGRYDTWWDPSPVYVHGINFLPITGGSLYLGLDPKYVQRSWQAVVDGLGGEPLIWRDVMWMDLALADPEGAAKRWDAAHDFTPEFGNSKAGIHHWIHTLAEAGSIDPSVTGDSPTSVVLGRGGERTYIGYNPGAAPTTVTFTDGATLAVPPRGFAHLRRAAKGGKR